MHLAAEETDAMAGELSGRLEVVEAELGDVRKRLNKLYEAIETSDLTPEVLLYRIMSLSHREEQLEAAREDAETQLEQRRVELPDTEEIARLRTSGTSRRTGRYRRRRCSSATSWKASRWRERRPR